MCSQSLARGADASCILPTEDSSGCAVGGDDRPYESRAGVVDASLNLPTEDSSGCAVNLGHGDDPHCQSQQLLMTFQQRTARGVQSVLVVMTVRVSH